MQLAMKKTVAERLDRVALVAASCVIYFFQALAWPLSQGRDAKSYLMYYIDMWNSDPMYPMLMLFRTPLAPFVNGLLLQVGGSALLEVVMGLLFCISILTVYSIGSRWGRRMGLFVATATMLLPEYGALYHAVSSDGLFAFGVILWAAYILNTAESATLFKFVWHGVFVVCLTLIRPASQILLLFAGFPFVLPHIPMRRKLLSAAVFLLTSSLLLTLWSAYNYFRYDDFTVSRSTWALVPLYHLFTVDRLVKSDNGPASAELAAMVRSDLLAKEPYVSYGIDIDTFFSCGNVRMWEDLVGLSDRVWGWESDYAKLRDVAMEAIAQHPLAYSEGVARTLGKVFLKNYTQPASRRVGHETGIQGTQLVNGRRLPVPTEGQLIPGSYLWWLASTPDGRIKYDWQAFLFSGVGEIADPQLESQRRRLEEEVETMVAGLPSRDGSALIADSLNWLSTRYPPMAAWIAVGALGLVFRRTSQLRTLGFVVGLALAVLLVTYLGTIPIFQYRIPFDPLFIIFGTVGAVAVFERARIAVYRDRKLATFNA